MALDSLAISRYIGTVRSAACAMNFSNAPFPSLSALRILKVKNFNVCHVREVSLFPRLIRSRCSRGDLKECKRDDDIQLQSINEILCLLVMIELHM